MQRVVCAQIVCGLMVCLVAGGRIAASEMPVVSQQAGGDEVEAAPREYPLEIDVLTQPQPSHRINAQKWGRVFQEMGIVVRFREGRSGERVHVANVERGGKSYTEVVGLMESDGRISFRGQKFEMTETEKIEAWLAELRKYGASGPPASNPTWGLTDEQFGSVTRLLSAPVEQPVEMQSAVETIDALQLPSAFRIRFTEAARSKVLSQPSPDLPGMADFNENVQGMSKGTVLAIVLAQFGLGFRPQVAAEGGYILEIDAGDESSNLWPVGWKTKEAINVAVPEIFKPLPVDLEDVPVSAIVDVLSDRLKVPYFYSTAALNRAKIDASELRYTRKPEKIPPSRLMSLLGDRFQMGMDVRTDESGKCFLWVTTKDDYQAFRKRFAHVVPGKP